MNEKNNLKIDIKKMDRKTRQIEWTQTLEIPYEKQRNSFKKDVSTLNEKNNITKETTRKSNFINTVILEMKLNPFYQPEMNTTEFNDTIIEATIRKNNYQKITEEDQINALQVLLEKNLITKEEFEFKKNQILNKKSNNN